MGIILKFIFTVLVLGIFVLNGFIAPSEARGQGIATVEDIGFELEKEGIGVVTIKVSEVVEYKELPTETGKFEIKIDKSWVPGELEVIGDVSAFASPVRSGTSLLRAGFHFLFLTWNQVFCILNHN